MNEISHKILKRLPEHTRLARDPTIYRVVKVYPAASWVLTESDWLFPNCDYSEVQESFILVVDNRAYTPESDVILIADLTTALDSMAQIDGITGTYLSAIFWRDELWGYSSTPYRRSDFAFAGCIWPEELIANSMCKVDKHIIENIVQSYPDMMWYHVARKIKNKV